MHAGVVGACEVTDAGAFDLDDTRAEVGQLAGAERRRDRVFERDDGDAVQWPHQTLLGMPSTCSATCERIGFVEIGAT